MKPPFRWVGGKTKMLPHILPHLPGHTHSSTRVKRYFEPMVGGGAVFWEYGSQYAEQCFLNDVNVPLMCAYSGLRSSYGLMRDTSLRYDDYSYNALRDLFNQEKKRTNPDSILLGTLFVMLVGTGFNGLYRENLSGGYNTPQGKDNKGNRHAWNRVDWERLQKAGARLRDCFATLACGSIFPWPWVGVNPPGLGDVVVYDPPFAGEFSDYHSSRFTLDHHTALRDQAQGWAANGATVVVCGSNNEWSWKIYGKPTEVVTVRRTVGNSLRGDATEALYVYSRA